MKVNKRQLRSLIMHEVRRITEQIDTSVPPHQRHKADAILMERIPGSITIIDPTTIFDLDSSGAPTREEGADSKGMRMKGGHYESLRTPEPLVVGENLAFLVKRMEISSFGMSLDLGGDRYRMGVDPNASSPEGHWLVGEVLWIEGPPTSPGKVLLGSAREVPLGPFNEGRRLTEQRATGAVAAGAVGTAAGGAMSPAAYRATQAVKTVARGIRSRGLFGGAVHMARSAPAIAAAGVAANPLAGPTVMVPALQSSGAAGVGGAAAGAVLPAAIATALGGAGVYLYDKFMDRLGIDEMRRLDSASPIELGKSLIRSVGRPGTSEARLFYTLGVIADRLSGVGDVSWELSDWDELFRGAMSSRTPEHRGKDIWDRIERDLARDRQGIKDAFSRWRRNYALEMGAAGTYVEETPAMVDARNESISRSLQAGQVTLINHSIRMSDMRSLMEGFMLNEADVTYTVVSGDVLSRIANRFYGNADRATYTALADVNDISDPNKIEVGQEISIPGELTVNGVEIQAVSSEPEESEETPRDEQPDENDSSSDESDAWESDLALRTALHNISEWGGSGWQVIGEELINEIESGEIGTDTYLLMPYMEAITGALEKQVEKYGEEEMLNSLSEFSSGFLGVNWDSPRSGEEMIMKVQSRLTDAGYSSDTARDVFDIFDDRGLVLDYAYEA